jgi:hypothetical protein
MRHGFFLLQLDAPARRRPVAAAKRFLGCPVAATFLLQVGRVFAIAPEGEMKKPIERYQNVVY